MVIGPPGGVVGRSETSLSHARLPNKEPARTIGVGIPPSHGRISVIAEMHRYTKLPVNSRHELTVKLFDEHYVPARSTRAGYASSRKANTERWVSGAFEAPDTRMHTAGRVVCRAALGDRLCCAADNELKPGAWFRVANRRGPTWQRSADPQG